jgi:hypothetical protein
MASSSYRTFLSSVSRAQPPWYEFLNCGYQVPAVGGTDKMSRNTAVGTVRTYARVNPDQELTYALWMQAIRDGDTFVAYGPLLDSEVDGWPARYIV